MDKKRRDYVASKKLTSKQDCKHFWSSIMTPIKTHEVCGILHKKFQFLNTYGNGNFEFYSFDGLYIGITDVSLKSDLNLSGIRAYETLELSFLIEGEQIISLKEQNEEFIYESQECYLLYLSNNSGNIRFHKNKPFKEVKIRMNQDFIKRHKLQEAYKFHENYTLQQGKKISKPICVKTQEILTELLSDQRQGLLKRLFLESKVLELLSLQLDTNQKPELDFSNKDPKSIKKIYQIQTIINSDLTEQFSIQQLARKVGLNDFIVKKEFKRIFGETIFEYALNQRMSKARKLLKHSRKPIYEISELVGYKNATHFTAAFKKTAGITPKKYRNASTIDKK
ncbi:AraC family transcriptional regulator [Aquimarina sp. 2304DJ70-9]|uniref:AraC family transcriptional regulator n=1 Tax=Aquimarina penaris TaxID=3231044 RepID=UPI0034626515